MGRHTAARKCIVLGIKFASLVEGARYLQLVKLRDAGRVTALECHPHYDLFGLNGGMVGRGYTADFRYVLDGTRTVVEDVKGRSFRDWPLRRDLFADNYPELEFYTIKRDRGTVTGFKAKRINPKASSPSRPGQELRAGAQPSHRQSR